MTWHRIRAILLRHGYQTLRDFNKTAPIIYWALLDVVLFGLTGAWLASEASNDFAALMGGVVLWQIIMRANLTVALLVLEEIWAHNIVNLFTTPLTPAEWIIAAAIEGGITCSIVTVLCAGATWYLYGTSLLVVGVPLLAWMCAILFVSGLSVGLFSASLLMLWGNRIQSMVWMFGWLFAPLSTAYYGASVLPIWVQKITYCLPMVYVFDSLRSCVAGTAPSTQTLWIGSALALFWIGALIALFYASFRRSTAIGLARLVD